MTAMKTINGGVVYDLFCEVPEELWEMKRNPIHEWDFGDNETVHASLKRLDASFLKCNPDDSYGVYLGKIDGQYAVGVHRLGDKYNFTKVELFESTDEMYAEWMLD